jgi:outer membrane protein, heavy metal efflux system
MSFMLRSAATALALCAWTGGALASWCERPTDVSSQISPGEPLTLSAVLSEIRHASPAIRAAGLEARALGAEADQAGRWNNPTLAFEVENFAGSNRISGLDRTESTVAIEQTFRLGGKRVLEQRAARARQALGSAQCEVILRESQLEAASLFAELLAAIQLRGLAQENADLADELVRIVARRVEAGAGAPPELFRAQADATALHASVEAAQAGVDQRAYQLALLWGSARPTFSEPIGLSLDDTASEAEHAITHPALSAADAAVQVRQAETDFARSAIIPDVSVSAGVRRFEETDDEAFVASVSVPLPIFDRGRDTARAAAIRGDAAALNRAAAEQRLLAEQRAAVAAQRSAERRLQILQSDTLPAAQQAYEAAARGYQIGRFDLTTTLNARAALLSAQLDVVDAEFALLSAELRLRALIGAAPFDGDPR